MASDTYSLLERLLDGAKLTPTELDELVTRSVPEDQYLEYKDGKVLAAPKKGAGMIREYVSGFANSSGGVLIIGVEDGPTRINGAQAPEGGRLQDWASDCLTQMAAYLMPPPRFQEVSHVNGVVLVIAVARAPGLVPDLRDGRIVYRLRIGDQMLEAPEYLVSDLMLGRRQQAALHVVDMQLERVSAKSETTRPKETWHAPTVFSDVVFGLVVKIENRSLTWAEDVQLGIVCWHPDPPHEETTAQNTILLGHINAQNPISDRWFSFQLVHHSLVATEADRLLKPFAVLQARSWESRYRVGSAGPHRYGKWRAAMYLMARNAPVTWYQISVNVTEQFYSHATEQVTSSLPIDSLDWGAVWGELPVVALEGWKEYQISTGYYMLGD